MTELVTIQQMLADMLKVFHDFCVEHSLTYYVVAGTALGAARHKGFIPWDDDVDVGMPRPDYERFLMLFNKENKNKRYILESPETNDELYCYAYAKLYDTHTTLIEKIRNPLKRGLYLDIMPLDGAGNKENDANKVIARINYLVHILELKKSSPSKKRILVKRIILRLFYWSIDSFYSYRYLRNKINCLCKTFDWNESTYVTSYTCGTGKKNMMLKSVWGKPCLSQFEGITVFCPEKNDVYLTHAYGNWKEYPPKDKQITHISHQ